ncbi:MAG: hypothetical protein KatS3mg076_2239 [Candidatus Binatia bacterium]|nr:MAG: hypothetical protein KatS3mg076_2239 [Candidatus Binatia bacterium]
MAEHEPPIPLRLEDVVPRLRELEIVFGPGARGVLEAAQASLLEALAARDRGDRKAMVDGLAAAMERLGSLAEAVEPSEAVLVRAVVEMFRRALERGNPAEARQVAEIMFERSGAKRKEKKG